ncbi:IS200/IS605 family transposase [Nostoc sp. FACHB-280]|uniref:IS200/IS605 family transposase n=1 Tax=Nostoc sp. FACHB-280 TaxID=2692839 RepID=UPI00168AB4CD|nr:IS200/IS605 family transposase [Nostoc sp. FACHB-280]MBD2493712.1 IS200/IS605 family transposase [Nostoc sp. FACHB-280]
MRANFTQLYLHYVWATWDRLPLITPDIQRLVYAAIIKECEQLKCTVIAVGGIEEHVHLLTGFPVTISVSDLIKQIKGSSSHFINHEVKPSDFFKWQGSYAAFTVSHDAIDNVAHYIRNQAIHHQQKSIISAWELTLPVDIKGD